MKNTDMKLHLGDVQETALIPLAIRAAETGRKKARISDQKAVGVRKKFFHEAKREQILAADILAAGWTDCIPKGDIVIVIAEGLFMHFSKEQVKIC
ncbi:MAG: hypothetical protein K2H52_16660 [Lachnospiraceae bacterium]|nr:hypothetical protein [Lachnospiraceae bacterium]